MYTKIHMNKKLAQFVLINFVKIKKKLLYLIANIYFIKIVRDNGPRNKIPALNVEQS